MSLELSIDGQAGNVYIGWSPRACTLKFDSPQAQAIQVLLKGISGLGTGNVSFYSGLAAAPSDTLTVTVPADGSSVNFFIAGIKASTNDQDTSVVATDPATGKIQYTSRTLMVRVRKNANTITNAERDRFLTAFGVFNLSTGPVNYTDFLTMHNTEANTEIHTTNPKNPRCSFLLWHRAFVLDLERQLQKIDASVTIPYWKFDEPAPNVFSADFMGAWRAAGSLVFNAGNPLVHWTVQGKTGIIRKPLFQDQTSSPAAIGLKNEADTIAYATDFLKFRNMENDPHGSAHESFEAPAPITDITRATQDPLFFLLHANVDRLWALWQQVNKRYDISDVNTYPHQGAFNAASIQQAGDYLLDTMWPWNNISSSNTPGSSRPPSAPGGAFPQTTLANSPASVPQVWEMVDYQAYHQGNKPNGADYDTILFNDQNIVV